jgi:hypothetical protein
MVALFLVIIGVKEFAGAVQSLLQLVIEVRGIDFPLIEDIGIKLDELVEEVCSVKELPGGMIFGISLFGEVQEGLIVLQPPLQINSLVAENVSPRYKLGGGAVLEMVELGKVFIEVVAVFRQEVIVGFKVIPVHLAGLDAIRRRRRRGFLEKRLGYRPVNIIAGAEDHAGGHHQK